MIAASKNVEIMTVLNADCFSHERLLLSNMNVRLEALKQADSLCLQTSDDDVDFKLNINSIVWYVRKYEILSSMQLALEEKLANEAASYPIRRTAIQFEHIEAGRRQVHSLPLSTGQLPRRIVLGFISQEAYMGDWKANPFNFQHFNVKKMQLHAGGIPHPRSALEMDFANKHYARAYLQMITGLNTPLDGPGNGITYEGFGKGYALYVFDLTPDGSDSGLQLVKEGSVTLDVEFQEQVPAGGIKLVVYLEHQSVMYIDKNRDCFFDFTQ